MDPGLGEWIGSADSGRVRDDWAFRLSGSFGPQRIRVYGLPEGWTLKSIQYLGKEIADTPVEPQGTQELTGVQVVVTDKLTRVSGAVTNDKQPVSECTVIVFAADAALWGGDSRFVRTVRPDQASMFEVKGLPPGDYLAVALDYVAEGDWNEPEYLETIRGGATSFTLQEREQERIALRLYK